MKIYDKKVSEFSELEYGKAFNMMSDERKSAVMRKKFENDRKASVLGEWLARRGISEKTGIPEEEIEFYRTENGKPFCKNADVYFSISHSKDMAICVVDDVPVGIDIEFIRPIEMRTAKFFCNDEEMQYLYESDSAEEMYERFFRLWTAKEAYVKCKGTGIIYMKEINYSDIFDDSCLFFPDDSRYIASIYREE